MSLQNWKTQLRKGLLELCVLNYLQRRKYHGYELVQYLKRIDVLQMREGTIYPILARLEEDGLVTHSVRPSENGPPRKYFQTTRAGRAAAQAMNRHWKDVEAAVRLATSPLQETCDER